MATTKNPQFLKIAAKKFTNLYGLQDSENYFLTLGDKY